MELVQEMMRASAACSPTITRLVRALLPCVKSKSVAKRCYLDASALAKRYRPESCRNGRRITSSGELHAMT